VEEWVADCVDRFVAELHAMDVTVSDVNNQSTYQSKQGTLQSHQPILDKPLSINQGKPY
jgi:hypothetical protein